MGKNNRAKKKKKSPEEKRIEEARIRFQQERIARELETYMNYEKKMAILRIMLTDMYVLCEKFRFSADMIEKFARWQTMGGLLFAEKSEENESERPLLTDMYARIEQTAGTEFMMRHFGELRRDGQRNEAV